MGHMYVNLHLLAWGDVYNHVKLSLCNISILLSYSHIIVFICRACYVTEWANYYISMTHATT
jgi:hypothetical protein